MTADLNIVLEEQPTKELLNLKRDTVCLDQLYLDPNNPRFGVGRYISDQNIVEYQDIAQQKIESIGIEDLLPKIRHYGFVPTDIVVVRHFGDNQFVVLEGNRRVATLKKLVRAGEIFDKDILASMLNFEVLIYEGDNSDIVWLVQGLRHVSGIKEWRPLQQAAFISKIAEQVKQRSTGRGKRPGIPTIARSAGVSPVVASRLLKSYNAFNQAQDNEEFGHFFKDPEKGLDKFSMFNEAVFKSDTLQTWLGWTNEIEPGAGSFKNENNFKKFLEWISPSESGGQARIIRALDARDTLPAIIDDADLLRRFDNGSIDLDEAKFEIAQKRRVSREPSLSAVLERLKELLNVIDSLPFPQIVRENRRDEFDILLNKMKQSLNYQTHHETQ